MKEHIHFIGIGGIGMSALARYFKALGHSVSGSDMVASTLITELKAEGISIIIGHKAGAVPRSAARVIRSAAVRSENLELKEAVRLGIPVSSYAEALGEVTKKYVTLAVAGTHGKSTTTALLALMLIRAGLDPTVIVGTRLAEFGGSNMRLGKSRYLVIEADEYDRSFLHYSPAVAVVTNVDADHLDTYGTLAGVIAGFRRYLGALPSAATAILNDEDMNSIRAARGAECNIVLFNKGGRLPTKWPLQVPGRFNQLNAEAAFRAAQVVGVSKADAMDAVREFKGSWRRMEPLEPLNSLWAGEGALFFSDYAHHPKEIEVTTLAIREAYPKRKILVVFEPHQRERLTRLFPAFTKAFLGADEVAILPIYVVAGRETGSGKTAEDLCAGIAKNVMRMKPFDDAQGKQTVVCLKKFEESRSLIKSQVVIFMGAGAIDGEVRKHFKSKLLEK